MADGSDLITTEMSSWIGRATPPTPLIVMTLSDVRRYVDATGDRNPLWCDDDYAKAAGYQGAHSAASFGRLGAVQHQGKSRWLERGSA